jgi:hypothetical protein
MKLKFGEDFDHERSRWAMRARGLYAVATTIRPDTWSSCMHLALRMISLPAKFRWAGETAIAVFVAPAKYIPFARIPHNLRLIKHRSRVISQLRRFTLYFFLQGFLQISKSTNNTTHEQCLRANFSVSRPVPSRALASG